MWDIRIGELCGQAEGAGPTHCQALYSCYVLTGKNTGVTFSPHM